MAGPFKLKSGNTPLFKSIGGSALKDLGHGGHPGLTEEEAAAATHGGKIRGVDLLIRQKKRGGEFIKDVQAGATLDPDAVRSRKRKKKAREAGLIARRLAKDESKKETKTYKDVWETDSKTRDKYGSYEKFVEEAKKYKKESP